MKEQLTAKEIKEGLSPTPWKACHEGDCICGQIWSEPQDFNIMTGSWKEEELGEIKQEQMKTNVKAATIAVNNTYGKGLNPEVYEDVVKYLGHLIENEIWTGLNPDEMVQVKLLYNKARI